MIGEEQRNLMNGSLIYYDESQRTKYLDPQKEASFSIAKEKPFNP
jgi:hypothetical protein